MNKYGKKNNRKNQGLVIALVVLSSLLVAMLLLVWKLERGNVEQIPETELPETISTETAAEPKTEATETEPEETEPQDTEEEIIIETEPKVDAPKVGSITYEEYLALPVEAQQAYYNKFESPDAFFLWLKEAKAEYDAATEPPETFGDEDSTNSTENPGIDIEEDVEDWE